MDKPKLIITSRRSTGKTQVISSRLPDDMVERLDSVCSKTGRSRNEILIMMIDFAFEHLEIDNKGIEHNNYNK